MKCKYCEKEVSELVLENNKKMCIDCACSYGEARYFEEQKKKELEAISNLDDCNPLGVMVL